MRTVVLAAGVLLVVALVAYLVVGKWKNPLNLKELPQRLGVDIKAEGKGITYSQSHGGHTLFKIHASKEVQLKENSSTTRPREQRRPRGRWRLR
jgi:lipopolysaccharide export system protein LptA